MIEKVVRSAASSKADEVIVVLGHEAQRVKEALKNFQCKFVFNEDFERGQSYSVKAGVKSVMGYADAVMVLPGDVALITPKSINMVIEEYETSGGSIIVASHEGRLGHPILFDRCLFDEIMEINEETMGLKAVLNRRGEGIKKVEVGSNEVLIDVDSEEDLKKISKVKILSKRQ
jgi:molybdenum cofactor cytidylyltransferase